MRKFVTLVVLALGGLACGADDTTGAGRGADDDDGQVQPEVPVVSAQGVTITQVAMYQGIKRVLFDAAGTPPPNVGIVAGRDALIRVSYTSVPESVGEIVVGRLHIGEEKVEVVFVTTPASVESDMNTTVNFIVPGDLITEQFSYNIALVVEGKGVPDNPGAYYPAKDVGEGLFIDAPKNTFRVVFVPYQYNADGSGRLPSVVDQAELYRQRLLQLYPVSDVEVVVREPVQWNSPISPNGEGWQEVGFDLYQKRQQEKAGDDWYYYAIFSPTDSIVQFCGAGCLLGVTLLNDNPTDFGDPNLRIGLGVGFPDVGPSTAAHELGHAHGRGHAPCGGVDPSSVDLSFPHEGGGIGQWGWDIVNHQLIDPNIYTDIMGYCDEQWISDYNFNNLMTRGAAVNMPKKMGANPLTQVSYELISVDASGSASWARTVDATPLKSEGSVAINVRDDAGHETDVRGHYYHWDHLPGGIVMFPTPAFEPTRADIVLNGASMAVER
jgi:hypothetical protein